MLSQRQCVHIAFGLSAILSMSVASVQAQDAAKNEAANAREAYAEGKAKFDAGDFAGAEESFQRAYDAVPNPIVLLVISKSRESQGKLRGAANALEKYMMSTPEAKSMEEHQRHVEELRSRPGTLHVKGTRGATVLVDGEPRGKVPADIELNGKHSITVQMDGYQSMTEELQVEFAEPAELVAELSEAPSSEEDVEDDEADEQEEEAVTDTAPEASGGIGVGVWVASGIAAASLIAGTVLGFQALSLEADFNEMPLDDTADKGERFALIADILFGVSIVAAITAVVLFVTSKKKPQQDDDDSLALTLNPVVAPNGGGVSASLAF